MYSSLFHKTQQTKTTKWKKSNKDWVCTNSNGVETSNSKARCGGVVRNCNGEWLCDYSKNIGICIALLAEL